MPFCACGEPEGALYYACHHNCYKENDTPILIEFEALLDDVVVDGNDFLYTLFQLGNPPVARPIAESIFGAAILQYIDRAWLSEDRERIAICDLAVQDEAVIKAHSRNEIVIAGRHGTHFRSAFLVKAPVSSDRITNVRLPDKRFRVPDAGVALNSVVRDATVTRAVSV